ncbi:MAG: multinuclear nonheme iron-dependent oxidase, partial [Solimonas sp.]
MKAVAGIGLRAPHLPEIERQRPVTGFLEIHAENYLAGSPALSAVERLRADYTFSLHAVGLSLGSAEGL